MKLNDWMVATLNNPQFDAGDFQYVAGMTLENTLFLPKEQYLKSNFIKNNDAFKDSKGNFSEAKFNDYYKLAAGAFAQFSLGDIIDNYEYSMWDERRPLHSKVANPNFQLGKLANPDHVTYGVAGFLEIGKATQSRRELALNSKIYDPATGKYLDKSVNDISFFESPIEYVKSLFGDPLVYATYDLDTYEIDPFTGENVLHKKGEWKVNLFGEYYTEKLNGRSLVGKEVVSAADYITSENSAINKYDFMDSDDMQKSVFGTAMKTVVTIAPLFIPYVDTVYGALLVGRELQKSLPMMYGILNAFNSDTNSLLANTLAAYGEKFTTSTSDYAKENTFALENFASLLADVPLLWTLQTGIVKAFTKLSKGGEKAIASAYAKGLADFTKYVFKGASEIGEGKIAADTFMLATGIKNLSKLGEEYLSLLKSGKWAETIYGKNALGKYLPAAERVAMQRQRMGLDLSLAYMAIISNTDVYSSVLEHGGTPKEAAAMALGSMIGMYSVDKYLGLGEMFFEQDAARIGMRQAARKEAEQAIKTAGIKELQEATSTKGLMSLISKGTNIGKNIVNKVATFESKAKDHTLGFLGKAIGEGLEEVSEELVTDFTKQIGEIAGQLGIASQTDYGAWDDAFSRYVMSFLGGAAGGGIYYVKDAINNLGRKNKETILDITYWIRQGKKKELLSEIDKMYKKGMLGSSTLSWRTTEDENGNSVYLTVDSENESQSKHVYNMLTNAIELLDLILNENQLNLSDDELFERMVQGDFRALALKDWLKDNAKDMSYITKFQTDYQNIVNDVTKKELEIRNLMSEYNDPAKRGSDFKDKLDKLNAEKEGLLKKRDLLFGKDSLGYVEKMLFAIDAKLSGQFTPMTFGLYIRQRLGKDPSVLTEAEQTQMKKEYDTYKQNKKMDLDTAFSLFKSMLAKLNPTIGELGSINIEESIKLFNEIAALNPFSKYLKPTDKLPTETEELHKERITQKEGESDADFIKRRNTPVEEYNNSLLTTWMEELGSRPIDRNTFRNMQGKWGVVQDQLIDNIIRGLEIPASSSLQQEIHNVIKTNGFDPKNRTIIEKLIKKLAGDFISKLAVSEYGNRGRTEQWNVIKDVLEENDPDIWDRQVTRGDMFSFINNLIQPYLDLFYPDYKWDDEIKNLEIRTHIKEMLTHLNLDIPEENFDFEENLPVNQRSKLADANEALLNWYIGAKKGEVLGITTPIGSDIEEEIDLDSVIDKNIETTMESLNKSLDELYKSYEQDPSLKALRKLESAAYLNTPVMKILKKISQEIRGSSVDIEEFLDKVHSKFANGRSASEFTLSDPEMATLELFKLDIEMAKAFIYAASVKTSFNTPVGHNKQINEFTANHKGIFGEVTKLPEIDEKLGMLLIQELNLYQDEMKTWIERSTKNLADKVLKFVKADENLNKTVVDFFKNNRENFKINADIDLLEGYENLTIDETLTSSILLLQLLHNNFVEALNKGNKAEDIIKLLIPKICSPQKVVDLFSSKLDHTLDYSQFTDYDKFALVISNFAMSSKDFYGNLLTFIKANDNLAPLAILEYAAKLLSAQQNNPNIINSALEYIRTETRSKAPILYNTTIITGVGGSGKTQAVAKMCSNDGTGVWVCGPTESLVNLLVGTLPKASPKQKALLMKYILGDNKYAEMLKAYVKDRGIYKLADGQTFFTKVDGFDGNNTILLSDNVSIKKVTLDKPKFIIVDEATHFNTAELLVLSKFCKENGISLVLMGDNVQNGEDYPGLMENMNREYCIAWRTPRLFLSLRDRNFQKIKNLNPIIDTVNTLHETRDADSLISEAKKILDNKDILGLHYYDGEKGFFGELITDDIDNSLMTKITEDTQSGKIGFVGKPDSEVLKKLLDAGKLVEVLSPNEVLGREYDYVVIDKEDLNFTEQLNDKVTAIHLVRFLQDLYTMMSRSRKGTIFIDHGLSKFINNFQDIYTGESDELEKAVKEFRSKRIPQLESVLSNVPDTKQLNTQNNLGPNNPTPNPTPILGTHTTVEALEEEKEPEKLNDDDNEDEIIDSELLEIETIIANIGSVRCYSNVSYSGIRAPKNLDWINDTDSHRDLGIFVKNGEVVKLKDKHDMVKKLITLKCLFNYGFDLYSEVRDSDIRRLFTQESLEQAEYWIDVADATDYNRLVGLTDLRNDKRGVKGKVITVIAKIKGTDGQTYELTLGGMASPETWSKPANKEKIKAAILKKIDSGAQNANELQEYLNTLDSRIEAYSTKLDEIIANNKGYRINKPTFNGMTTLILLGDRLRLENINDNSLPFYSRCPYAVTSPIYSLIDDIPGLSMSYTNKNGKEVSLKGKAVIFVSSNILLSPSELKQLYLKQKNDSSVVPLVRMIVLDNMGVGFESLYRDVNDKYKSIYSAVNTNSAYVVPFETEPMSIRMYMAAWNFRANLIRFNEAYRSERDKLGMTDTQIEELAELDNKEYERLRGDAEYLDEDTYRKNCSLEVKDKVEVIWKLNDSLKGFRQFRVGYSRTNGAYIRKLTNVSDQLYPNGGLGIYINPTLASEYELFLDSIFTNMLDKIIDTTGKDKRTVLDTNLAAGWFSDQVQSNRELSINASDGTTWELKLPPSEAVSQISNCLVRFAKFASIRGHDIDAFNNEIEEGVSRYSIKIGEDEVDWVSIIDDTIGLESTIEEGKFIQSNAGVGIRPHSASVPGGEFDTGYYDQRIDNLFNLMFHGSIHNRIENDFTKNDIRATDAMFKYGFFSDVYFVKVANGNKASDVVLVATNPKLFASNVVPGLPIMGVDLSEYQELQQGLPSLVNEESQPNLPNIPLKLMETAEGLGITIKASDTEESIRETVESTIKSIKNDFVNTKRINPELDVRREHLAKLPLYLNSEGLIVTVLDELGNAIIIDYSWHGLKILITTTDDTVSGLYKSTDNGFEMIETLQDFNRKQQNKDETTIEHYRKVLGDILNVTIGGESVITATDMNEINKKINSVLSPTMDPSTTMGEDGMRRLCNEISKILADIAEDEVDEFKEAILKMKDNVDKLIPKCSN